MTLVKGVVVSVVLALAGALLQAAAPRDAATPAAVRLKAITARPTSKGTDLVVEATQPVAYLTTRPDPLTILLDFRNVDASAVTNNVQARGKTAIAGVTLEAVAAEDAAISRVRIALTDPVMHRVRSEKNAVIVELDKADGKSAPYVLPAAAQVQNSGRTSPVADPIAALSIQALSPSARPAAAAVQAVVQTPGGQPAAQAAPRQYTGTPISLQYDDADLKAVLIAFSQITGLNVIIDQAVQGAVTVQLTAVPWDQALDLILRQNKLGYILDGTIVRIAPLAVLADEETQRRKLAEEQALSGALVTYPRVLSYARAEDIAVLLSKSQVLSTRRDVQVDGRTNTIIITDLQRNVDQANALLNQLDKPQPQVEIEARIVQANKNYSHALGVQWGFNGHVSQALGNTTGLAFPNSGTVSGAATPAAVAPGSSPSTAVNLAAPAATSAIGLTLGSVNGAFNLDLALSAAQSSGNARLLSTPKVSTLNNVRAEITQGVDFPIQTQANNTVTTTFKTAALTLSVVPQITAANTIIMQIALENATPDFSKEVLGIPSINTQRANTTVLVLDGQTTVIGGIYSSNSTTARDSTPGLSNIPLLGWLFRRDATTDDNKELLIFITPRIIQS